MGQSRAGSREKRRGQLVYFPAWRRPAILGRVRCAAARALSAREGKASRSRLPYDVVDKKACYRYGAGNKPKSCVDNKEVSSLGGVWSQKKQSVSPTILMKKKDLKTDRLAIPTMLMKTQVVTRSTLRCW